MNILKKLWLYKAKKKIIEKYNQHACDETLFSFMDKYRDYEYGIIHVHTNLVQIFWYIDYGCADRSWYEYNLQKLNKNLEDGKVKFENLFKQYRHSVRMYHWMYTHGYHNKYAKVLNDGELFKECYESKIEKYEMEFKPFNISFELKKYLIEKRKKELENDFDS